MRLGPIVLALRAANTRFGTKIGGAAELGLVLDGAPINDEAAFVVQIGETVTKNQMDTGINQTVTERFAIYAALKTNTDKKDKFQLTAYDELYTVRAQFLSALLGLQLTDQESVISYAGGSVVDINRAFLWYQFEFEVKFRLDDDNGVQPDTDSLSNLEKIYAQWMLAPNSALPLPDGTTLPQSLFETNLNELITWPREFGPSFGKGFDVLEHD